MKYHIFISHAWKYDNDYKTIEQWIKNYFTTSGYSNYSVPKENPLHSGNTYALQQDLTEQISHANCVIIIGGMYGAYSDWMDYEISEAKRMKKYIILVRPWGQQRVPQNAVDAADIIVGWNSASVIDAIIHSN